MIALVEAVHERWAAMFGWLGLALIFDAIDGPLARALDIGRTLPDWSGDTLDLVVDFTTYVFVPAYAIMASGLLLPGTATALGAAIVVSGALYFADKRMKTEEFKGKKEDKELFDEATVWVGGLDRVHRARRIARCYDFSATPFAPSGKHATIAFRNLIVSADSVRPATPSAPGAPPPCPANKKIMVSPHWFD